MSLIMRGAPAVEHALESLRPLVQKKIQDCGRPPGLCIVQIGNDPASSSYIKQKEKMALGCDLTFLHKHFASDISLADLKKEITTLTNNPGVDGVLVQLPMDAAHLKSSATVQDILTLIPPHKDADGLHPLNQGRLFCAECRFDQWTSPLPCTAYGVMTLLSHYGVNPKGMDCVVIGRSRLVGMPTAVLLTHAGATVTVCHSQTTNLTAHTQRADLIVAAAGVQHLLKPEMIGEGCVLVDVGIHRDTGSDNGNDSSNKTAAKLHGDIHPECYTKARAYSPVPGGVGPTTVGMLIANTLRLYLAS